MKQLIFLFLFSVCAGFAHGQAAINGTEGIVISGDTWVAIPGTDLKLNPITEPTWRIEPSDHYTTLELRPAPSLTLEHDPNKYLRQREHTYEYLPENIYEVPWMTKEDLLQIIEKLEARIEDLEAKNKPGTTWEAGSGLELQESYTHVTIINKKTVESDPEPTATIKGNGDLVITTPVTVGGSLDTIITKGNETWRIVATISAQQISQEEIDNQIRSIEAQIESIARTEKDLLKLKRRLSNGKKSKAQAKSKSKN